MSRLRRLYYRTSVYHIYNRGNNRIKVFKDNEDKIAFLETLSKYQKRFKFVVYGFVLMDNHYHMMVETCQTHSISKVMHALTLSYGRRYQLKYKYVGHLWQSRFKSRIIETEIYGLECLRYIHENPVKAGLVDRCESYLWSSARKYVQESDSQIEKYIAITRYGDTCAATA